MSVKALGFTFKSFSFPCGERHVIINDIEDLPGFIEIEFEFYSNEDIIELMLLADALKELRRRIDILRMPYVPYSRQDRINIVGECFSLKLFCYLINTISPREVIVTDPHSDVCVALLKNCTVIPQHEVFENYIRPIENYVLVSPDGGALKKIYKLAAILNNPNVLECTKKRDIFNGEITGVHVHNPPVWKNTNVNHAIIVDDICDGGRTFIEIAKALRARNFELITLCVTHGFFTKGLEVFDGLIDNIYTRKGKVK